MDRDLCIELLRAPGVNSEAYALLYAAGLSRHRDIIDLITTSNFADFAGSRYAITDEQADELLG